MPPSVNSLAPIRPVSIWRWVLTTVLGWHLVTFVLGVLALSLNSSDMPENFRKLAMEKYWSYIAWNNLQVLLYAYVPTVLVIGIICQPVVRWMLRYRAQRTGWSTRWAIVWRTIGLCFVITSLFTFRTLHTRPWLVSGLDGNHWYFTLRDIIPVWARETVVPPLLEFGPWFLAGLVVFHYLLAGMRRFVPRLSTAPACAIALCGMAVVSVGAWAGPAYYNRISEVHTRQDDRPNILILASDSLRADRLGVNGYHRPTSPNIDALASRSINFQKCFTPIASTVESMTSMMASQYPHTTGLQHMFPNKEQVEKVKRDAPSLAGRLKEAGYDTAVMGDWCAGVFDIMPMGFEKVDATTFDNFKVYMSQAVYMVHPILPLYFDNPVGYALFPKLESSAFYVTPEVVTDRLKDRLARQTRSEKPFFWTVFYSSTHIPYTVGPKNGKLFSDPAYKGPHKHKFDFSIKDWIGSVDLAKKWEEMPKADVDQINALYDGCVRNFDDNVKSVLEQLAATGMDKKTVILITGDHGDNLFEPNCTFGHGLTFNGGDQNTNVPCIIHIPGTEPRTEKRIVRTLDFAPTLLDLAKVPVDSRMEGHSLRPYLEGTAKDMGLPYYGETSYLFCRRYIPGEEPAYLPPMDSTTEIDESFDCHFVLKDKYQATVLKTKERVLRTERWKFVYTPGKDYNIERLYDLQNDPNCLKNVALDYPDVFTAMKNSLWLWIREKKETRIPDIFPQGEPASRPPTEAS